MITNKFNCKTVNSETVNDKQIVAVSVPLTDTSAPMMAPALLKGILEQAGFNCVGFDLNGEVYNRISELDNSDDYFRFFYYEEVTHGLETQLKALFDFMVDRILSYQPHTVCLSLLHYQCQVATKWLCFLLKKKNPDINIVIGGAGAFGSGLQTNELSFVDNMLQQGLIDYYISGDGDIAIVELIKGNINYPGINQMNWKPIEDLNSIAYPIYEDYDFNLYESAFVGILGSRGCVRQCTFCDIHEYWSKFKWRSGDNIFQEMLMQNKKYGVRHFKFQDSLINGNVKEYNQLIRLLAQHNRSNPDNTLHWASYFILRPQSQMSEEQWRLTAESGAIRLNVGIESLVERNRDHIKKKFSNADIEYGLSMAKKYNVGLLFILLVGYVTETEQDHDETLEWLRQHSHYARDPIKVITVGGTLSILPGTWLARHEQELGVTWKSGQQSKVVGKNHLWEIKATGNNYETRIRRMNEIIDVGSQHGFTVTHSVLDPQKEMENIIKDNMNA